MGMFDYVKYSAPCSKCGIIITEWQSKDGPCFLENLEPEKVQNFYGNCPACGKWHDYKVTAQVVKIELVKSEEE